MATVRRQAAYGQILARGAKTQFSGRHNAVSGVSDDAADAVVTARGAAIAGAYLIARGAEYTHA
jgi:hypothetical protein